MPGTIFFWHHNKLLNKQDNLSEELAYTGLAVSKMPHVRQSHAIKHVLYYGVR